MLRKKKVLCPENAASSKKAKGQSTIEYIILIAAVVGAILIFAPSFRTAYNSTLTQGTNGMENMAARLSGSRP